MSWTDITKMSDEVSKQKATANLWASYLDKLACRLKGSCSPKITQAVASVGKAGYKRYRTLKKDEWYYYLPEGMLLRWHTLESGYWDSAQVWFLGSGYAEKLKNAGLDPCCLKSKWPPSEAFPPHPDGKTIEDSQHIEKKTPDGKTFWVDPYVFDALAFQQAWENRKPVDTPSPLPQPIISGGTPDLSGLALPLLAFLFLRG